MSPPGTVCCFMCKGMVIYKKGDKSRFNNHMNNEHGVVFELDFLFATCKLNQSERVKVKDVIENELMVEQDEIHEFNEESVKKQLRRIIPVPNKIMAKDTILTSDQINCQFCDKSFSLETNAKRQFFKLHTKECKVKADEDDDIEVIKSVTAADKSVERLSKHSVNDGIAELEQISKKRRLSGNSVASSGVSAVSSTIIKARQEQISRSAPPTKSNPSDVPQFKVPSSVSLSSSVNKTPRKTPILVPSKTPKKSPFLVPKGVTAKSSFMPQTPMKSTFNARTMQTPLKANLKTPMKSTTKNAPVFSTKTPMKTPLKSNKERVVPLSTVKKPNSGYAPSMYPCDACDRGYASSSARSQHKKKKHTSAFPAEVKQEKAAEDQHLTNFPLLYQGNKSATLEENSAPEPALVTDEGSSDVPPEPVNIRLFACDGCGNSYKSSMKLNQHKKRSCKGGSNRMNIKTESDAFKVKENASVEATLGEIMNTNSGDKDMELEESTVSMLSKTKDESSNAETDEIQNMLMLDNADDDLDDDDDEDEDIEVVDIIFDQTPKVQKEEIPIGKIKNETQVEATERAEMTKDNDAAIETGDTEKNESEKIGEHETNVSEETTIDNETNESEEEIKTGTNSNFDAMFEECLKSKFFVDQPSMFSKCSEGNLPTFHKTIKFLPGWKLKKNEVRKKNGDRIPATHFLSPENIVIRSGLGVIEYLRMVGAKPDYLNSLSLKLKVKPNNFEAYVGKYMFDL